MTAHPKVDPRTGEMFFFSYFTDGMFTKRMALYGIDRDGQVTRSDLFDAPFNAIVHDFFITEEHIVIPIFPLTGSMERALAGNPPFAWEPDLGTWVAVVRRDAPIESLRWFRTEACFVFHPMNGWLDGKHIVADMMQFEVAPLFPNADGSKNDPDRSVARLCRWHLDLEADSDVVVREYIDDSRGEFPRIDERFAGVCNRHGFFAASGSTHDGSFDQLVHLDHVSGEKKVRSFEGGDRVSEPVFVPRSEDATEGDGYLLATVYRAASNRSDLVILDTDDIRGEPIAIAELQHRIPHGFHGIWRAAA